MNIYRSKIFRAGNSDAVRLPKDLTPGVDTEVEIIKHGDELTIRPVRPRMTPRELVDALRQLPKPPAPLKRDPITFPKRKGL